MAQANRRSGNNPLAYLGVEPVSPTNFVIQNRAPSTEDYYNFNVGDEWLDESASPGDVWKLVNKDAQVATWVLISSGGSVALDFATDSGTATPSGGTITMAGGTNINTVGAGATVTYNLDTTLTGITSITTTDLTVVNAPTFDALGRGVVQSDASGVLFSSEGSDGQVLISSSAGAPAWATLTAGSGVSIANGNNSITISAGAGIADEFDGDVGTAVPALGVLEIVGGANINTSAATNVMTVNLDTTLTGIDAITVTDLTATTIVTDDIDVTTFGAGVVQSDAMGALFSSKGTDGEVLISSTAGVPAWASLTAGANITITPGANSITIASSSGTGVDTIDGNTGSATGASTLTVAVNNSTLPAYFGGSTVNFHASGTSNLLSFTDDADNTGVGFQALGSATAPACDNNTAFGFACLRALDTGINNCAVGSSAGSLATSAENNTIVGTDAAGALTTGNANVIIGVDAADNLISGVGNVIIGSANDTGAPIITSAGTNYTSNESNNICIGNPGVVGDNNVLRIGTSGTGSVQQSTCYIAGINGVNAGSVASVVSINGDQLGETTLTAGSNVTITPGPGTITIASTGGGGGVPSYSIGTFTPALLAGGTAVYLTITTSTGHYTKIGNLVYVFMNFVFAKDAGGLASGDVTIDNLPFTIDAISNGMAIPAYHSGGNPGATANSLFGFANSSTNVIDLKYTVNSSFTLGPTYPNYTISLFNPPPSTPGLVLTGAYYTS